MNITDTSFIQSLLKVLRVSLSKHSLTFSHLDTFGNISSGVSGYVVMLYCHFFFQTKCILINYLETMYWLNLKFFWHWSCVLFFPCRHQTAWGMPQRGYWPSWRWQPASFPSPALCTCPTWLAAGYPQISTSPALIKCGSLLRGLMQLDSNLKLLDFLSIPGVMTEQNWLLSSSSTVSLMIPVTSE